MTLTESQLRHIIRKLIVEHVTDEDHEHPHGEEEESNSDEEPMGDESIKKVYSIAKEVNNFL